MSTFVFLTLALVVVSGTNDLNPWNYNPVANPKSVVISGNARFTVLSERLIRMEYSNAKFEDRATLAIVNRNLPPVMFHKSSSNGWLNIETRYVKLSYKEGQTFQASTLMVVNNGSHTGFQKWAFGDDPKFGNLFGTIKSLDEIKDTTLNCSLLTNKKVHNEHLHCVWGMASRQGWVTINDQDTPILDATDFPLAPAKFPSSDSVDTYLFAHGTDYKAALFDFMQTGGKYSLSPRYSQGIWWSRWYDYNDVGTKGIVDNYESRDIPLDILILDMDWHTKFAWGGYTWDPTLFPDPADAMSFIRDNKGLHTGVNLHDDTGVRTDEAQHAAMAKALGLPTTTGNIPFDVVNKTYMHALEDIVMSAAAKNAIDFWWIDWQQGGAVGGCTGHKWNPTIILNHVRHTDHIRRGENLRGLTLARWGGYGNQRYPVGFSGDVNGPDWTSLAYQPYFSLTAANVGYWWSHDIVGPAGDNEQFTRWVQWASYSGAFRTHDRGMSAGPCAVENRCGNVEIWNAPPMNFEANRDAMRARVELMPYIYNLTRYAYDFGVGPMRPMYYDWPNLNMAYSADEKGNWGQYMLGDSLLVSPVTVPADKTTMMADKKIWLPPGTWVEMYTGMVYDVTTSNYVVSKPYDIREVPVFVKAGAIIPNIPIKRGQSIAVAKQQYSELFFSIYPGANSAETVLYEDDGMSLDYIKGGFTTTKASYKRDGMTLTFTLAPAKGKGFKGMLTSRNIRLHLVNSDPIKSVTAGSMNVPNSRFGGPGTWWMQGEKLESQIDVQNVALSKGVTITVTFGKVYKTQQLSGLKGAFTHANWAHDHLDKTRQDVGAHLPLGGHLATTSSTPELLGKLVVSDPKQYMNIIENYPNMFLQAFGEVLSLAGQPANGILTRLGYGGGGMDHWTCQGQKCMSQSDAGYTKVMVEGYGVASNHPGAKKLNVFYNKMIDDHLTTTATTAPSGYVMQSYDDGYVMGTQEKGSVPLQLWWSEQQKDSFAVASPASMAYVKSRGYVFNTTLGYVMPVQLHQKSMPVKHLEAGEAFIQYAVALLQSSFE